jgi:hypothetical protein
MPAKNEQDSTEGTMLREWKETPRGENNDLEIKK